MLRQILLLSGLSFAGIAHADSLTFPSAVSTGCLPVTATLTLTTAAPTGGRTFDITSSALLSAPPQVTVAEGTTVATFQVTTGHVDANTVTTLTAIEGATTLNRNLTLRANAAISMSLESTLGPGQTGSGAFTLACVTPTGGQTVALTSSSANLSVPATVFVPEGQALGLFSMTASDFSVAETVTVTATRGGVSRASTTRLKLPAVRTFTFSTTIPVGGQPTTGLVELDVPAGAAGVVVDIVSANPAIAAAQVASITIPSGTISGSFAVDTVVVDTQTVVVFTVTANAASRNANLTVRRNRIENIRASQLVASICRGIDGEVKLLAGAGAAGSTVTLSTDRADVLNLAPTTLNYPAGEPRATFTATTTAAPATPQTAVITADFNSLTRPITVQVIRTSGVGCP